MKITSRQCRMMLRRILNVVGLAAAGAGAVSLASNSQVFAHHFLQAGTDGQNPVMVYSPELQIMVKPGTDDPVFPPSSDLPRGKANGEYQVAPLVNCPGSPGCPPPPRQPTSKVTPGGGPNGAGPHADGD
jgi:hypothetical protein